MKKNKLVNIVLVMIITLAMLFAAKTSFAANNVINLTDTLSGINNTSNKTNTAVNNTANNTTTNTVNNTINTTTNTTNNTKNNVLTTNNTSKYNNSALPDTGIEDSFPAIFVIVLGISAIYAYNKIQYYKNI